MSETISNNGDHDKGCPRTILRIKRRRTEEPLPYIRLEGLDGRQRSRMDDDEDVAESTSIDGQVDNFMDSAALEQDRQDSSCSTGVVRTRRRKKSCAVWRRLSLDEDTHRSYKIVDAVLEGDGRVAKRRKLTLLDTSSTSAADHQSPRLQQMGILSLGGSGPASETSVVRRKTALIKVLDPLSRMVDDSLQMVHAGTKGVDEHYRFVTTDQRLAHESKKWLAWCHSSGGNILHACALWNDVEMASEVLGQQLSPMMAKLTEAVDGDGRTPYEVAQLSGHDSVCQVLESFGGDTTNYVYDIFCLEEGKDDDLVSAEFDIDDGDEHMTVELRGGVGYWTPEGELVLEAPEKSSALSLTHVFDEDGEIDSNCEEYGANDYPDEDAVDWGDGDGNGNDGEDTGYYIAPIAGSSRNDQFLKEELYSNVPEDEYDDEAMMNGI